MQCPSSKISNGTEIQTKHELDWSAARELRVTMMNDIQTKMVEFQWEEYRGNPLKVQEWIERKQP